MLTIEYCKTGEACNDFELNIKANMIIQLYKAGKLSEYRTSSELLVTALRVLILRKEISHEEIEFLYNSRIMIANVEGRLDYWPDGFCDHNDKMLCELVKWD